MSSAEWVWVALAYLAGVTLLTRRAWLDGQVRNQAARGALAFCAGVLWPILLAGFLELWIPCSIYRGTLSLAHWVWSGVPAPEPQR